MIEAATEELRATLRKHARTESRCIRTDLRRMRRIQQDAHWLGQRDSNASRASFLVDAIGVLIKQAIADHTKDLEESLRWLR